MYVSEGLFDQNWTAEDKQIIVASVKKKKKNVWFSYIQSILLILVRNSAIWLRNLFCLYPEQLRCFEYIFQYNRNSNPVFIYKYICIIFFQNKIQRLTDNWKRYEPHILISKGKRHSDFNHFQHKLKTKERRSSFGFSYPHNWNLKHVCDHEIA